MFGMVDFLPTQMPPLPLKPGGLREVQVELGTDDADLVVSMNDGLLRGERISDQAARKQASQGGRGRTGDAAARRFEGHGEHYTQRPEPRLNIIMNKTRQKLEVPLNDGAAQTLEARQGAKHAPYGETGRGDIRRWRLASVRTTKRSVGRWVKRLPMTK